MSYVPARITTQARWPIAAASAIAAAVLAWHHDIEPVTVEFGAAIVVLAIASACDCEKRVIPNACIAALLAIRVAYLYFGLAAGFCSSADAWSSIAGAVVLGAGPLATAAILGRATGDEGIGGGDVKLFICAGAYFGIETGAAIVLASCVLGLIGNHLFGNGTGRFAFGPAIALAMGLVIAMI